MKGMLMKQKMVTTHLISWEQNSFLGYGGISSRGYLLMTLGVGCGVNSTGCGMCSLGSNSSEVLVEFWLDVVHQLQYLLNHLSTDIDGSVVRRYEYKYTRENNFWRLTSNNDLLGFELFFSHNFIYMTKNNVFTMEKYIYVLYSVSSLSFACWKSWGFIG